MKKVGTIKIGKNIQRVRKSNGYTQEKLAEEVEVSARYISDVEQDRAKPSYEVLIKICNTFNIGLDDIFSSYLNRKNNQSLNYGIAGYDKLNQADQKTIEHLIMYFNKSK